MIYLEVMRSPIGGLIIFTVAVGLAWIVAGLDDAGKLPRYAWVASAIGRYVERWAARRHERQLQAELVCREREIAAAAVVEDTLLLAAVPAQCATGQYRRIGGDPR